MKLITFKTRKDARAVLKALKGLIKQHGFVSLMDYYDLCDAQSTYTDDKFGWTSLLFAHAKRLSINEYVIIFPVKPFRIKMEEKNGN